MWRDGWNSCNRRGWLHDGNVADNTVGCWEDGKLGLSKLVLHISSVSICFHQILRNKQCVKIKRIKDPCCDAFSKCYVITFSIPQKTEAEAVLFTQVACFGRTKYTAFLKAMMSSGFKLPRPGSNIMVGVQKSFLPHFLPLAKRLHTLGYKVRNR